MTGVVPKTRAAQGRDGSLSSLRGVLPSWPAWPNGQMGAEQSAPERSSHNPLTDGWASTDPELPPSGSPPPRRVNPPYQPSFLTQHVKSQQKQNHLDPPVGTRSFRQGSHGASVGDSYMLAHAKKAKSQLASQSARVGYYSESKPYIYSSETYLTAVQKKAQGYMAPIKSAEDDHVSHVAGDDMMIMQARNAAKGRSNLTGITTEWNKFAYEGGPGHQELEEAWTQSALKAKRTNANFTISPHVGVAGKIGLEAYENAFAIKTNKDHAPDSPANFRGIKPQLASSTYMIEGIREQQGEILAHSKLEFLRPANLFPDDYMITHVKKTTLEPEPLRHQLAAACPPHASHAVDNLLHLKGPEPSQPSYRGKKTAIGIDSYLMNSSRKVASNAIGMVRGREVKNHTPTKLSEIRL